MPSTRNAEEDQLIGRIIDYAHLRHLLVMHPRPCRTENGWRTAVQGDEGYPDLTIAGPGGIAIPEVKSNTGTVTEAQRRWLTMLELTAHRSGTMVIVEVWRPRDWDRIRTILDMLSRPPNGCGHLGCSRWQCRFPVALEHGDDEVHA